MRANSLTRAMLASRWVFSITLAASATLIEGAGDCDALVCAVAHDCLVEDPAVLALVARTPVVYDIKGRLPRGRVHGRL